MEQSLRKIAFVAEEFGADTPAQQLLDRFLMGYPRDGEFHRPQDCEIHAWLAPGAADAEFRRRLADFPLRRHDAIEQAVAGADGIVVVPKGVAAGDLLASTLKAARKGSAVFVCGAMADTLDHAKRLAADATSRGVRLCAGTSVSVTWRLPDIDLPPGTWLTDALIVVRGEFPVAELQAIDGLMPLLERRQGGEAGVRRVQCLEGETVWALLDQPVTQPARGDEPRPLRSLLAAALSRSDAPQGEPVRDGRTQDLVGLGLVPKMATHPRAWLLDHGDGLRTALLVLDGVVADFNFAVRLVDGSVLSAQLYRPPAPQRHEFSRLSAVVEDYFRSRQPPWPVRRGLLTSGLLEAFAQARSNGGTVATPTLDFAAPSTVPAGEGRQ